MTGEKPSAAGGPLKVTCRLAAPLCGQPPQLDSLLEYALAPAQGFAAKLRRDLPVPEPGSIRIPILRGRIGGLLVARSSSPVFGHARSSVEHVVKQLAVEHAGLLEPRQRLVVATGNSTFKSYRLPLHVRPVDRVVWFTFGDRKTLLRTLNRHIHALGKKRSVGYARIAGWEVERIDDDYSWFAESDSGTVLMRPLPVCDELPEGLDGARRDFASVQPPYWHPDRYCECVVPC